MNASQQLRQRPKSAIYQAVEDKVFLLDQLHAGRDKTKSEEQNDIEHQLQQLAVQEDETDENQDNVEIEEQEEEQVEEQEKEQEREENEDQEEDEEDKEEEDVEEEEQLAHAEYDGFSNYDGSLGSRDTDPFLEYHHFDDQDFEDFLKLGPLELKLLNVSGKQMPINRPEMPKDEMMRMKQARPDHWPVTVAMLHRTLRLQPRTPRNDDNHEEAA